MRSRFRIYWPFGHATIVSVGFALLACSSDRKTPATSETSSSALCSAGSVESDLDLDDAPFMGPAVDESGGAPVLAPSTGYVVSSTYGVPNPGPDGAPWLTT